METFFRRRFLVEKLRRSRHEIEMLLRRYGIGFPNAAANDDGDDNDDDDDSQCMFYRLADSSSTRFSVRFLDQSRY